eukprot:422229-Rhodomonas_salina.1
MLYAATSARRLNATPLRFFLRCYHNPGANSTPFSPCPVHIVLQSGVIALDFTVARATLSGVWPWYSVGPYHISSTDTAYAPTRHEQPPLHTRISGSPRISRICTNSLRPGSIRTLEDQVLSGQGGVVDWTRYLTT